MLRRDRVSVPAVCNRHKADMPTITTDIGAAATELIAGLEHLLTSAAAEEDVSADPQGGL